jgi:hypothetical protein
MAKFRFINTKLHGILDYSLAFTLYLPWIVDYERSASDSWLFSSMGTILLLYSLFTDYEFSLIKLLPIKVHLVLDVLIGVILMFSPMIFNLRNYFYFWPSIIGASFILLVTFSSARPYEVTKRDLDITKP